MPRNLVYAPDGYTWYATALAEAEKRGKLHDAITELRRVWWDGADLDKDKIAAACLALFKVDHDLHTINSATADDE